MENLTIMHISDLHYSKIKEKEISFIRDAVISDIDNFVLENKLKPNFIIFSGDLLFKPDQDIESINEFNNSYDFFIQPILEKLNLTNNEIFITAGNHDVNRSILLRGDRNGLLSYKEEGNESANELITEIVEKKRDLPHLKQFNNFVDSLNHSNNIYSDGLINSYKIDLTEKISIGIVNLNSNILAFDENSYGNLILGEEQLNLAYSSIKDCDIKVANIHHPVSWLSGFEQILVKKFYYKKFNIVFLGHEHTEQPELINYSDEDTLILSSASIFQGKNNLNGYSIIDYSFKENLSRIYSREYDQRETKFSKVSFSNNNHHYQYPFNILSKSKNKKNLDLIIDTMSNNLKERIKKDLLFNIAKSTENSVEDIFVEPHLYTQSEFTDGDTENKELYTIHKILHEEKHIVIKGIESTGKTTFLNYLANEYLCYKGPKKLIPIILNKIDISDPLDDNILFAKTIDFLRKLNQSISTKELESLFRLGDFVFLIDNVTETENCTAFIKSLKNNIRLKNNKFIFTSKEEVFDSLEDTLQEEDKFDKLDIIQLYIYNLKRSKAREFFKIYFGKEVKSSEFEDIFNFISKLHIPLTIFNYTLIALTYENQKNNFKPVNEAYLLDIFMENLLEKLDIQSNISFGALGYNIKSDYLIYLAKWMVTEGKFQVSNYTLMKITLEFITQLKREKENIDIKKFIKYFEEKGLLVAVENNNYRFRYNAFLEFFIAKGMLQDKELKEIVLNKDNYFNYKNEINYYSGLHGQDEDLINFFRDILSTQQGFFNAISYTDGRNINTPLIDIDTDTPISIEQIDTDKKDIIYEKETCDLKEKNEVKSLGHVVKEEVKNRSTEKKIFETNVTLMKIIRNSEQLKNPELKTKALKEVTSNLSKFLQMFLNETNQKEQESLLIVEEKDKKKLSHIYTIINIVIAQSFMSIAQQNLVSDSLYTIYSEIIDETDDLILKLLIISTFMYGTKKDKIKHLQELIKEKDFSKNNFLSMSLFFKVFHSIKLGEVDIKLKKDLEKLLTDIIIGLKYKELDTGSGRMSGLHKKSAIESNKKQISEKIRNSISEKTE